MADHGMPFLYAVLLWWASTGAVVVLSRLSRRSLGWASSAGIAVAILAVMMLAETAGASSRSGAYIAFTAAVCLWGCIELSFLTGLVTGPRTTACPPGATGWRRFRYAVETLLYHELVLATAAIAVVALTWAEPNQTGTLTFLLLLAMRVSAKLNIFFGVPNLTDEMMPAHLAYLKSYFRKADGNPFFPVSMILAGCLAAGLGWSAFHAATGGIEATALTLLFTLIVLAMLEHAFMMLPLRDGVLWRWAQPTPPDRRS